MGQNLLPDDAVLSAIFPNAKPTSVEIIDDTITFDSCTFKATFDTAPSTTLPRHLLVAMETPTGNLKAACALHAVARTKIPKLVPDIHGSGKATTAHGKEIEYTITQRDLDTVTLESVWPSLHATQQSSLVDAVVEALTKVQQLPTQSASVGGPHTGSTPNMRDFLTQFVAKHQRSTKPTSSIIQSTDGITIKSALSSLGEVFLSHQDLRALDADTLLCHTDMEPRNVLVRRHHDDVYELAAITGWETAGFFPFAYTSALKDTELGLSNLHFDWYTLFKSKTQALIAPGEHSTKLIEAVHLIVESCFLQKMPYVSAEFRRRWMQREGLELHNDERMGWVKKDGARAWTFDEDSNDELELQVLKDLGVTDYIVDPKARARKAGVV